MKESQMEGVRLTWREWRRNYSGGKTGEEAQEVRRGEGGKEGRTTEETMKMSWN